MALAACSDEEGTPSDNPTPTQVPISAAPASGDSAADTGNGAAALPADVLTIANQRGLTPADVRAAMMTYTPSGKLDEYYLFMSSGQAGSIIVAGVPSMRILKSIAVFTVYGSEDVLPFYARYGFHPKMLMLELKK
jgi:tetrahydromethanopterin S-methyltransferase subunit D